MTLIRKMTGLGMAFAVAALLFSVYATTASAQTPPFTAYGIGLEEGDEVTASIDGEACGSATADADGNWLLRINADDPCNPTDGDEITFTLNGEAAAETATYTPGGAPEDVAEGISLTVADGEEPTPTATPDDDDDDVDEPEPSDTGNAGWVDGAGTSSLLILALGAVAATLVGGARFLGKRS